MVESLLNWIDRWRYPIWGLVLLALGASIYYVGRLEIVDSPERWMPRSTLDAFAQFDRHFVVGDSMGIGLHFSRPITEDDLPRLRRFRRSLEGLKRIDPGDGSAPIDGLRQVYDVSLVAEEIEGVPLLTLLDPQNVEQFTLYSGALWDDPRAKVNGRTLVTVCELYFNPNEPQSELNNRRRLVAREIYRVIDEEQKQPDWEGGVEFHLAGGIPMMIELEKRARQVALTFLPVSLMIGLVSLHIAFRSWRTLAIAVLGTGLTILLILGGLGAGLGTLGVVTMATPALVAIIAVASTMHFAAYAAEHGTTGEGRQRPELVRCVAVPCLGAALTTAVGFLMLWFNDLAPVRDLGSQLFVGSLLAFFAVFLLTQWLPIRHPAPGTFLSHERFRRYAEWITRRPSLTAMGLLGTTLLMVFLAWPRPADAPIGLYVDADPFSFFSEDQPIARALRHFSERKFGVYQLDVVLVPRHPAPPPVPGETGSPEYLANVQAAEEFSNEILKRSDLGVLRVISSAEFHRRTAAFQKELERVRREEGFAAAAAKLLRIARQRQTFEATFQSWSHDIQNEGALRLTFLAHDQGARGFAPLMDYADEHLPREQYDCYMCGSIAQVAQLGDALSGGIMRGLSASILIIVVVCLMLFGSLRLALLALPPNIFPVVAVYGLMGLFKIPISSGSAMVATIALGIAVNDTMHFILYYRRKTREEGVAPRQAIIEAMDDLGRPVVLMSVVFCAGFTVFLLTDFQPLFHFGILSFVAMTSALAGDLVMLPNLLLLFDRFTPPVPEPQREASKPAPPVAVARPRPQPEPSRLSWLVQRRP